MSLSINPIKLTSLTSLTRLIPVWAIPSIQSGIEILLAAPKKKVSHQKKRSKWLAPAKKQLKFLHNLNRCPTCGSYKRSHHICMNCFIQIKNFWKTKDTSKVIEEFSNELDEEVIYPGKLERPEELNLRKKLYLVNRHKTLPVE